MTAVTMTATIENALIATINDPAFVPAPRTIVPTLAELQAKGVTAPALLRAFYEARAAREAADAAYADYLYMATKRASNAVRDAIENLRPDAYTFSAEQDVANAYGNVLAYTSDPYCNDPDAYYAALAGGDSCQPEYDNYLAVTRCAYQDATRSDDVPDTAFLDQTVVDDDRRHLAALYRTYLDASKTENSANMEYKAACNAV